MSAAAHAGEIDGAATVFGPANQYLAQGAAQLEAGHIEEGVRLTIEGLRFASSSEDTAAAHSNACAGLARLKQWDDALVHCNAALDLDTSNWRIYNNRASIFVEKGLYELALRDLRAGLALAPHSATLLESMRVLEHNRRIIERHSRKAVLS